jgi:hypothetical protein
MSTKIQELYVIWNKELREYVYIFRLLIYALKNEIYSRPEILQQGCTTQIYVKRWTKQLIRGSFRPSYSYWLKLKECASNSKNGRLADQSEIIIRTWYTGP